MIQKFDRLKVSEWGVASWVTETDKMRVVVAEANLDALAGTGRSISAAYALPKGFDGADERIEQGRGQIVKDIHATLKFIRERGLETYIALCAGDKPLADFSTADLPSVGHAISVSPA